MIKLIKKKEEINNRENAEMSNGNKLLYFISQRVSDMINI